MMGWFQPARQGFMTARAEPGGLLEGKVYVPIVGKADLYLNLEAKSAGWVAGNPFLGQNVSLRSGVVWDL
jgi:hypothetical protein